MINYDKSEIREVLELENIFELLQEWGGDPEYTGFGILSSTICHNEPGEGSRKLYYYSNSGLFRCYTGCDSYFDIFELTRKVAKIQWSEEYDLNDAVRWIARRFGIAGRNEDGSESDDKIEDWKLLANYEKIKEIEPKLPLTTAAMQQLASNVLGFSPARTQKSAQKLYELGMGSG